MDEDLAFNYTCWKDVGTGTGRRLAAVLASTIYGQEALPDFLDTADGRIWPPHVESDDGFGPPEHVGAATCPETAHHGTNVMRWHT